MAGKSLGGTAQQNIMPNNQNETVTGILDWDRPHEGRLRQWKNGPVVAEQDPYVPVALKDEWPLRSGQMITATVIQKKSKNRKKGKPRNIRPVVSKITAIEDLDPTEYAKRLPFEEMTVIDPQPRIKLEHKGCPPACRLIDLFCPIGYGTRGLIVAPPKAGKTVLLQNIAQGIHHNHPNIEVVALLIDERPEEVTEFKRTVPAEVLYSSNDQNVDEHIELGIMAIERAKRKLEAGLDVVVLLDSLTRLGRAFNNSKKFASSGRTMSGGLDSRALEIPKQLFGAARNVEQQGSLTIIASCLVDTGSRADQVIFEEFKGTGNMELILDKSISEQRLYPAINLSASGTRKEDLLMDPTECKTVIALRRRLMNMKPPVQIQQLLAALERFDTNEQLVRK
ncbi:MAG: transcription termination factor Rho [Planctomycetota bacterium]|nr:transcription termination factor Rho [Planctomycetota bacterium]